MTTDPVRVGITDQQKFITVSRSLLLHVEVLTMTPDKTSTLCNKLLLWCINFYVEVSIGQKFGRTPFQDPLLNYVNMPQVLNSSALVEVLSMRVERACRLKNFPTPGKFAVQLIFGKLCSNSYFIQLLIHPSICRCDLSY